MTPALRSAASATEASITRKASVAPPRCLLGKEDRMDIGQKLLKGLGAIVVLALAVPIVAIVMFTSWPVLAVVGLLLLLAFDEPHKLAKIILVLGAFSVVAWVIILLHAD